METTSKPYFEYLDALRCVAFLAVFYAHSGTVFLGATITDAFPMNILKKFMVYGSYGVNFFFVLSGFLITYLLLKEKAKTGAVSIRNFYLKRVLRIWPVYFLTLFFASFVLPFLIPESTYGALGMTNPHVTLPAFFSYLFFAGNFYQGLGLGFGTLAIGILWSVCVEEQFYLVWPLVVKWLSVRKLTLVTILLISLSLAYKYVYADDRVANYYLPWSVGMDLAFGALLGTFYFLNRQRQIVLGAATTFLASLIVIAGSLIAAGKLALKPELTEMLRLLKSSLADCIFMLVVLFFVRRTTSLETADDHPLLSFFHLTRQKAKKALVYLGQISYGLYAYHTTMLMLTVHLLYSTGLLSLEVSRTMYLATVIIALAETIFAAHYSSRYFEKKFLDLKDRL